MLSVFLILCASSALATSLGYFDIKDSSGSNVVYPKSTMRPLSFTFMIMLYGEEDPPTGSFDVTISIENNKQIWKNFSSTLSNINDQGEFSDIFLPAGELRFSLSNEYVDTKYSELFNVSEASFEVKWLNFSQVVFANVRSEFCFTTKDKVSGDPWINDIKNANCVNKEGKILPEEPEFCFNQTFAGYGSKNLSITCNSVDYVFPIVVTQLFIKEDKFEPPDFSTDSFNISFLLYYYENSKYTGLDANFEITLELRENRTEGSLPCSGTVTNGTMKTSFFKGKAIFEKIKILSNGQFSAVAKCEGFSDYISPRFLVTNFIKEVKIVTLTPPMHFVWGKLEVHAIGVDNREFVRQVKLDILFKNFYCLAYTCNFVACYNCLPMRINETVSWNITDLAFNTWKYYNNDFYLVNPNPNAKVVFRFSNDWDYKFPFPAMHYDDFSFEYYIQNGNEVFYDIPCYTDNNYIERICVSEKCSNDIKVERIQTYCYRGWWTHTRNYVNSHRISSIGDYVYSIPFINDLNATTRFLNMTSLIKDVKLFNLNKIHPLYPAKFQLNITGQDNYLYIKQNDVEISSDGLVETIKFRATEGFYKFDAIFKSSGTFDVFIKSTHMRLTAIAKVTVDTPILQDIENFDLIEIVNVFEKFSFSFNLSNGGSVIDSCLQFSQLNLILEIVNINDGLRYPLTGTFSCNLGNYKISDLIIKHAGNYTIMISYLNVKIKTLENYLYASEKIYDALVSIPEKILKYKPFLITVKLYNSPNNIFEGETLLYLESQYIFGQKISEFSSGLATFYIYCDSNQTVSANLTDKNNLLKKNVEFLINLEDENYIQISSVLPTVINI